MAREISPGVTVEGMSNPVLDYKARISRFQMLINQEDYRMSKQERRNLLSTYNKDMYDLISKVYNQPKASKRNDDVLYIQEFLQATHFYHDELDGLYGKKTQAAMKDYMHKNTKDHFWDSIKDFNIFN